MSRSRCPVGLPSWRIRIRFLVERWTTKLFKLWRVHWFNADGPLCDLISVVSELLKVSTMQAWAKRVTF